MAVMTIKPELIKAGDAFIGEDGEPVWIADSDAVVTDSGVYVDVRFVAGGRTRTFVRSDIEVQR